MSNNVNERKINVDSCEAVQERKNLEPRDYSDVGQAKLMSDEYYNRLRYSPATDYIVYNESFWEESRPKAQGVAQELTERQLEEADERIRECLDALRDTHYFELLQAGASKKMLDEMLSGEQRAVLKKFDEAQNFKKYVVRRRDSRYIASALKEARPMLEIDPLELDADPFLLNTPSYTYDLRFGLDGQRNHDYADYITKVTAVDPSDEGKDLWEKSLNLFFKEDPDLIKYVQQLVGLIAIGKVFVEGLIIAYGGGRNGKSTFWNAISKTLGTYSGNISADTLTSGCRRNVKPELAEARGKRLLIAAELDEGTRLNTSILKQLAATDDILGEKKYKDPLAFTPTHMLVLYTNHLPAIGATDEGTWRRLIVVPFNARITGNSDIKNYGEYLFEHAGGAILSWIIAGAQAVIANNFNLKKPQAVLNALKSYREDNNWIKQFVLEACDVGSGLSEKSGNLYQAYREHCIQNGEQPYSGAAFSGALNSLDGIYSHRTNTGVIFEGLRLKKKLNDENQPKA